MADNPRELTTEELLIQLGRVVMGLGTKIDALGEKLDSINQSLGGKDQQQLDLSPVLEKMDELKGVLGSGSGAPEGQPAPSLDLEPLMAKMDELKGVLGSGSGTPEGQPAPVLDIEPLMAKLDELKQVLQKPLEETPQGEKPPVRVDFQPVLEKLDEIRALVEKGVSAEELQKYFEDLSSSFGKLPETLNENFSQGMKSVTDGLTELQKAAEDRQFVEAITGKLDTVDATVKTSGEETRKAIADIPEKMESMGSEIAGAMDRLQSKTGEVLDKAQDSLEKTDEALSSVKEELQKGLKLNTDMTGQMVELTSRFADRAEQDRLSELNSRAVDHYSRGEYSEADSLFREALELSPDDPELLCNSASVLAAMEDMKGAEERFRKALAAAPELEPAISGLGMVMVKTDRAEETIEFLKSTILSGKPSVMTTIAYTRALAACERHDEAVELLESALKTSPDDPEIKAELSNYGYRGE